MLSDAEGKHRILLHGGSPLLAISDATGILRTTIGEMGLQVADRRGKVRLVAGVSPDDGIPRLDRVDENGMKMP